MQPQQPSQLPGQNQQQIQQQRLQQEQLRQQQLQQQIRMQQQQNPQIRMQQQQLPMRMQQPGQPMQQPMRMPQPGQPQVRMQVPQQQQQQQMRMQQPAQPQQPGQMRLQSPQTPGTPSPNGFEPPQQIVGLQNRFSTPNSPFPTSVPNSIGAMQQMGMGMGPRVPGHPAVTAGLRLNIPSNPGSTPSSALPSPALTPRSEGGDEMDTGSSRGPTPGPDRMDGALTPDMMDPNKVIR